MISRCSHTLYTRSAFDRVASLCDPDSVRNTNRLDHLIYVKKEPHYVEEANDITITLRCLIPLDAWGDEYACGERKRGSEIEVGDIVRYKTDAFVISSDRDQIELDETEHPPFPVPERHRHYYHSEHQKEERAMEEANRSLDREERL